MLYLLYGLETFLIEREIKKILKNHHIENINISQYDLTETPIEKIIDDASTISLFSNNKAIIIYDSYLFTNTTKNNIEQDLKKLEQYLNNYNPNTIMIFVVNSEKLDERKKIVKIIKDKGIVKEFNKTLNLINFIEEEFDNYKINLKDINLLIDRVGKDLGILHQEITKIKIYKDDEFNITTDDIINLTNKNIETDIFQFIDCLINKNKEKALEIYHELLKINEEPVKIIVIIANQIRIMYQVKELYKKGYTEKDIINNLGIHPYRIKLALEKGREYESRKLLNCLNELADLNIDIKSGLIDKKIGLELFILKL
ncbi:MAG: DNA polymerase III subunit delta [Mollicutes bacterium]|nr:DNA polymerase III subunit delta [Mollicutes bacterium]